MDSMNLRGQSVCEIKLQRELDLSDLKKDSYVYFNYSHYFLIIVFNFVIIFCT